MGKILLVLASLACLTGRNDIATQNDAVTISSDYQDAIHAQNDAAFEYERLARLQHREMLMSQHSKEGAR